MVDTTKSGSLEQQRAEDEIFCMVEYWLGCKVSRNPKVKMSNNDSVHIEPDSYSEEHSIIGKIYAHVGENKRRQSTKIANDILKMLLIEKDRCKSFRKIIVVCDEQEKRTLSGKSALAESIRQFGIELEQVEQFKKDGFIDKYSGQKLVNSGFLKVLSHYMLEEFPYHSHWKMQECHNAYWEFIPTVNYIYPVALGGADSEENWATTSMLHNSIKNNWTLEQLNWKLYDAGNYEEWNGLTALFIELVKADKTLLEDSYIKKWYRLSR